VVCYWLLPTGYCAYIINNKKGKEPNTSFVFVYSWETWASLAGGLITGLTKRTFTGVRNKAIVRVMDEHSISSADNPPQLLLSSEIKGLNLSSTLSGLFVWFFFI
jgi:hypothetical protein